MSEIAKRAKILTVDEVAKWLNVSKSWVHDHASGRRRPILPSVKFGKSLRFHEDRVQDFIEECVRAAEARRKSA